MQQSLVKTTGSPLSNQILTVEMTDSELNFIAEFSLPVIVVKSLKGVHCRKAKCEVFTLGLQNQIRFCVGVRLSLSLCMHTCVRGIYS